MDTFEGVIKEYTSDLKTDRQLLSDCQRVIQEVIDERNSIKGTVLSEYTKRCKKFKSEYDILVKKRDELLTEFAEENKIELEKLEKERTDLQLMKQELDIKYNTNQALSDKVKKQEQERDSLLQANAILEQDICGLRNKHRELYFLSGEFKELVSKLEQQLKSQHKLRKKLESDKEINKLWEESLMEVLIDRESKTITRGD